MKHYVPLVGERAEYKGQIALFCFYLGNDKTTYFCIAESPKSTSALKQQPSLRRDKQKVVNNENGLNATPEFKSFVAKKLSDALDR